MSGGSSGEPYSLDLLSTSQKSKGKCGYGAPYVAVIKDGKAIIGQGCCNHWDCPRCRFTLAAYHKHRMIEGANILLETGPLYFWTITCRGKELDLATADDDYYTWINRLLASCRYRAKKQRQRWEYVQVTERQQRGAAHSHFIHTFCPDDAVSRLNDKGRTELFSSWFREANIRAELGRQCQITEVASATGVGAYISGYLEKQIHKDVWPPKWKRIRYSEGWPDRAEKPEYAKALMRREQWDEIDSMRFEFVAEDDRCYQYAKHRMHNIINQC